MEEVRPPLIGGNAGSGEGLDVVFHIWLEDLETANCTLEVEEEVRALTFVSA